MTPSPATKLRHPPLAGSTRAGFTMLELLVVLIVVGLMAAIAVPNFMRTMADSRLESSANRLFLDIKRVKLEASRSRTRHFIRITGRNWSVQSAPNDSIKWSLAKSSSILVTQNTDSLEAGVNFGAPSADSVNVPGSGISNGTGTAFNTPVKFGVNDDCIDGVRYPAQTPQYNNKGWGAPSGLGGLIVACGGAISDLTLGVVYLSADRSKQAFAISYNHMGGLSNQVRMFKFDGSTWREVQ